MKPRKIIWLDLSRHWGITTMTLITLGLTIGSAGILFRLSRLAQARFKTIVNAGDAIIGYKSSDVQMLLGALNLEGPYPGFLPFRLYGTLLNQGRSAYQDGNENVRLHRQIVPFLFCGKYHDFRLIGTTAAFLNQPWPSPTVKLNQGKWVGSGEEVVLGAFVAKKENLKIGQEILVSGWTSNILSEQSIIPLKLKISGVLNPMDNAWDRGLYTEIVSAQKIIDASPVKAQTIWGKDVLNFMLVYLQPNADVPLKTLINERTVAQVVSVHDAKQSLENLTASGHVLGKLVLLVEVLLGALSIGGLMLGRSETKIKQLAILKAMGFQSLELRIMILWEGLFLSIGAIFFGICLDCLFFPIIREFFGDQLPSKTSASSYLWESWPIDLFAIIITMITCSIPYLRFQFFTSRESLQNLSGN